MSQCQSRECKDLGLQQWEIKFSVGCEHHWIKRIFIEIGLCSGEHFAERVGAICFEHVCQNQMLLNSTWMHKWILKIVYLITKVKKC